MAQRCIRCMRMTESAVCSACGYPEAGQNAVHQLPVGTVLRDRYQIGAVLGQGGFGITYLAWDMLMEQAVAVKEFFPGGVVFRRSSASTTVECVTEEAIPHYDYSKEHPLAQAGDVLRSVLFLLGSFYGLWLFLRRCGFLNNRRLLMNPHRRE